MGAEFRDFVDVQAVAKDDQLLLGVLTTAGPPFDRGLAALNRVTTVDADTGPTCQPIRRVGQEPVRPIGVGQDDAQIAIVFGVPVRQNLIGRVRQFRIRIGKGGIDHGQFVGVGPDRLNLAAHGDQTVRGADEFVAQPL